MLYDVFICHASEDKESFVQPLARSLRRQHLEVWYDDFSLKLGDSIKKSLDKGLAQSRFGVVVLSPSFFEKQWPQYELDGLAQRETQGSDVVILPVWHNVSYAEVSRFSLPLANRKAVPSSVGMKRVVRAILDIVHPQGSPLISARDQLVEWGMTPPVITDEYWLHVVEASNRTPGYGANIPEESIWGRWSFPLPEKQGGAKQWGERLAWTAMQLNWVKTAEEVPISPITEPGLVLDFIDSHPGLHAACEDVPALLIEYAPQLTIRGMGGDFEELFEELYRKSVRDVAAANKRRRLSKVAAAGNEYLCEEEWALRHPTFGNISSESVVHAYFSAGMFGPEVSPYEDADHAFWLLSSASEWLPKKIRTFMIDGMAKWHAWMWWKMRENTWASAGALTDALSEPKRNRPFKWTKQIEDDVFHRISKTVKDLDLPDTPDEILKRFVAERFPEKRFLAQLGIEERKARRQKKA
jgi:hypothetical protein